ncbi:hypothetical protein BDR03DRAFT_1089809 [Suillus americanus]|nr:hypothetical protein BDR03DRAFT_1093048 [Suillus americanus]KAG2040818.1 hypothetical protein BDR03DRAFT_1089809 [Suillus americanus]
MFTARFTILALLTFLAGARAHTECATCNETLEVDGVVTYQLVNSYVRSENGYTVCNYADEAGDKTICEYANGGMLMDGNEACPLWSRMDGYGC